MHFDTVRFSKFNITPVAVAVGSTLSEVGDILLLVRGSMLFKRIPVCIVERSVAFNQDVKSVTALAPLTSQFLFRWVQAIEGLLLSMVTGTGIGAGKLDTNDLKQLKIFIPLVPEQKKIADFLGSVDEKINLLRKKRELLERYKRGLMQKLFSKELRFRKDDGSPFPDWEEKRLEKVCKFSRGKGISKSEISENGKTPCFRYGELYTK